VTPMLRGGDEEKWRTNTAVGNCPRDWVAPPLPISHREVISIQHWNLNANRPPTKAAFF
jgi:hypothetical protein